MAGGPLPGGGLATEAKVAFLQRPDSYPEAPAAVETVETHTSWLFLAGQHVYKLKKPLRYDFLDFSTLAARRRNCHNEVRLNRRLTHGVYLAALPLTDTGRLAIAGAGRPVDWLVKMRRLPGHRDLETQLKAGSVGQQEIVAVARVLAEFYRRAPAADLAAAAYLERIRADLAAHRRELSAPERGLDAGQVHAVADALAAFLERNSDLFASRVAAGRVIEAHGDLRPEHVYLVHPPAIIDCLEFNRELRILDAADELAFLGMECERLDAPYIAGIVFDVYQEMTGDRPPAGLIHFYMGYRALLWATLAIRHTARHGSGERGKWVARTETYMRLARMHIDRSGGQSSISSSTESPR
ncbi:MAG: hypothetical protein M3Z21_15075 [Pseudomonadota bacterium]|nr:hypothetical protein [Pseudomonadota bacterium]